MFTTDTLGGVKTKASGAVCRPAPLAPAAPAKRYIGMKLWDGSALVRVQDVFAGGKLGAGRPLPTLPVRPANPEHTEFYIDVSWGCHDVGALARGCNCSRCVGPLQLALAILIDCLGGDGARAKALHRQFTMDVIARLDGDASFVITSQQIESWLSVAITDNRQLTTDGAQP